MGTVHDIELYRENKDLGDLTDPCTQCRQQPFCINTCERASTWWDKVASKFKRQCTINKLGDE